MKKAITLFFLLYLVFLVSAQDRFRFFTPERKELCQRMGAFFDETIKSNFPGDVDSLSYKAFLQCMLNSQVKYKHLIFQVDREKLNDINQDLFKDKNYYFFYARQVYDERGKDGPLEVVRERSLDDTIPTVKLLFRRMLDVYRHYQYYSYLNYGGYIERIGQLPDSTGIVKAVKFWLETGTYVHVFDYQAYYTYHLEETSDPIAKELGAVLFWNYLCYCANIDLEGRKDMSYDD